MEFTFVARKNKIKTYGKRKMKKNDEVLEDDRK